MSYQNLLYAPRHRGKKSGSLTLAWVGMYLLSLAVQHAKANNPTVLSGVSPDTTATGSGVAVDVFYDTTTAGSDSYNGLAAVYNGTNGPKRTVPTTFTGTGNKKYAIVTGSTINTDYSSGSVNQGISINTSDGGIVYIVGWSRTLNVEITPAIAGYAAIVDQIFNTGIWYSQQYLDAFFYKMQGSGASATSGTQGAAFNIGSAAVIRNALVDGHVMAAQSSNLGYTLEDVHMRNGGRASAGKSTVTATISGTVMTVSAVTGDLLYKGMSIVGSGVSGVSTQILSQATGTTGGVGTYNISQTQTVSTPTSLACTSVATGWFARCEAELNGGSNTCSVTNGSTTLTVTGLLLTKLTAGGTLEVAGVPAGTKIVALLTGSGGVGSTYSMSAAATSDQTNVALIAGVQGMRIARCTAEPGAIGEDCIHQQPSTGPGPFGTVVTDCVLIHDAARMEDESQHADWIQSGRNNAIVIKRSLIMHQLQGRQLLNYQQTNKSTPQGSVFQMPGGGNYTCVDGFQIYNNVVACNGNCFNTNVNNTSGAVPAWNNNTIYVLRHGYYQDVLASNANIYVAALNSQTITFSGSNNWVCYPNSHFTPVTTNDGTHDCFISAGVSNFASGWNFVTS